MSEPFESKNEKPKMPIAFGLLTSFCTIRLSFSPASMYAPSSRTDLHTLFSSSADTVMPNSLMRLLHSFSRTSSTKLSRVPDVGGGPRTSIFFEGSAGSMSDHFS